MFRPFRIPSGSRSTPPDPLICLCGQFGSSAIILLCGMPRGKVPRVFPRPLRSLGQVSPCVPSRARFIIALVHVGVISSAMSAWRYVRPDSAGWLFPLTTRLSWSSGIKVSHASVSTACPFTRLVATLVDGLSLRLRSNDLLSARLNALRLSGRSWVVIARRLMFHDPAFLTVPIDFLFASN
ncbi:hypothetical protein R1flu_000551 [Riccia fluitans]|uniref:Uncharacterized protein n=1 Tax=Riccia fluitans TaxID=41844 RepID=A0ABD1Y0R9_9MARC